MEAKELLSNKGYGSGTNYTTSNVAHLMQEYADQQTAHLTEQNKMLSLQVEELSEKVNKLTELIGDIHCNHEQYGYLINDVVDRIEQVLNERDANLNETS